MQEQKAENQIEEVCLNMERTLSILPGGGRRGGGRDRKRQVKCSNDVLRGAGIGLIGGGPGGPASAIMGATFGGVSAYVFSWNCRRR
jgi:hypothetical protein